MTTEPEPLAPALASLRSGERTAADYVAHCYDRADAHEDDVQAFVDGPKERGWTTAEARALAARHPDPGERPPLYGVPVGAKDIFHVDGLPTKAGSTVPPGEIAGPQAAVVSRLRAAGALVFGKTVTTEFAYFEPGPTRNPHDLGHTPGGSSSGSAAAVAAGMCPLALGSQTIGSVIRPASFCGVVGFKPSYGRIPLDGVVPVSPSLDHVGLFTQDVAGAAAAAPVCVDDWDDLADTDRPVLGVPDGDYLGQADDATFDHFEAVVEDLAGAGYEVRHVAAFADIEAVNERHDRLVPAEMALSHEEWFESYGDRYGSVTTDYIERGQEVSVAELAAARRGRLELRAALHDRMAEQGVDVWLSPAAPGPAPSGIDDTGDPVMNLPWTHAGVPAVSLPAGRVDGLPVGLQCTARFGDDERLLAWAAGIENALDG